MPQKYLTNHFIAVMILINLTDKNNKFALSIIILIIFLEEILKFDHKISTNIKVYSSYSL